MLIEYLEERQSFIEISVKVNFTMRAIMCENCIQPGPFMEENLYKSRCSHDDAGEEIGFGDVGSDTYNDDAGKGIDHQQVALHSSSQGTYRGIGGEKQRPKLVLGKEFTPRAIVTISDWNRFLTDVFSGWNTLQRAPKDPILSNKSIHDSHIVVGKLNVTLPLTMEQIKSGATEQRTERCANAPVCFRLYPQLRNWLYLWTWKDEGGSNLHSDNVRLDPDMDDVKIRAEAIYNYDAVEIRRVRDYNRDNVRANARRAIKKWSQEGSHKRNDEDSFYWN
ncbi:hypothetical protein QSH57_009670 [Fusarium oxysporum f. sp. vasinfectum]|nr:hypothetical protein QSH57_009670 [Fusarium oxysporum f. sp. vasinfectum]